MKSLITTLAVALVAQSAFVSSAMAACEQQSAMAALNYVTRTINDNDAGTAQIVSTEELVAGKGSVHNGIAEVVVGYHMKNITSVHDYAEVTITTLYHAPSCTILQVLPNN